MIPTVFGENQSLWDSVPKHGIVDLVDCISCKAVQTQDEDSAEWELELTYPCSGQGAGELAYGKQIVAKANSWQPDQIFRIYSVVQNINKTLTVKAQHIYYDLGNVPVKPFKVTSAGAFPGLVNNNIPTGISHHFTFSTNISDSSDWEIKEPMSILSAVLDGDESWKGQYPGDIVFNNYSVSLLDAGGQDRDTTINYGIDLIDMEQEKNISEMSTGILPYIKRSTTDNAYDKDDPSTHFIYGSITYNPNTDSENVRPRKIEPMDLSQYFKDKNSTPSVTQINNMALKVVKKLRIGLPKISLKVSYAYLGQDVRMFDSLRVRFPKLGIDTKAKVVKYQYDVLLERVEEVELGYARSSKYFRLMDASKLRKGILSLDRLADQSIDDKKIARGGVGKGSIGTKAVDTENIEDNSIHHEQLAKVVNGVGPIQKDNIGTEVIRTGHIKHYAIEPDLIAGGALNSKTISRIMVNGTIDTNQLNSLSVTHAKIATGAVSLNRLTSGFKGWVTQQGWTQEEQ